MRFLFFGSLCCPSPAVVTTTMTKTITRSAGAGVDAGGADVYIAGMEQVGADGLGLR